jgi:pyridoxine 5-phosphate synthase
MVKLSVNVNKVALVRNSRGGTSPSVLEAAGIAIGAGCHGITVHPRPDARHITYQDVIELAAMLAELPIIEFNIEGFPGAEFLDLVCRVRPHQCTLVPDPPGVLTSNAGWKLAVSNQWVRGVLARLRDNGIRSSLFVEPDPDEIRRARAFGADRIELYTGPYAHTFGTAEGKRVLSAHRKAAAVARAEHLGINAGHDLNLDNIPAYVKAVKGLMEVSIGHALISDAMLHMGLGAAVKAYLKALGSRPAPARIRPPARRSKNASRARAGTRRK